MIQHYIKYEKLILFCGLNFENHLWGKYQISSCSRFEAGGRRASSRVKQLEIHSSWTEIPR